MGFEIGFMRTNKGADVNDPNNKKPWFRGTLKIDGQDVPVVFFRSAGKNGDEDYWTIKPDSPRPNAEGRPSTPQRRSGGSYGRREETDIPF